MPKVAPVRYKHETWSLSKLFDYYKSGSIELSPSYQRNPIWSLPAQRSLINTLQMGWPLPNIFLKKLGRDTYEVVDGQQRLRAIFSFLVGDLADTNEVYFSPAVHSHLLDYSLATTIIDQSVSEDEVKQFYALVNKTGLRLNRPELAKAEHSNSDFFALMQELADDDSPFTKLKLFPSTQRKRMEDVEFVGELLLQLEEGITDKKDLLKNYYTRSFADAHIVTLRARFNKIIDRMISMDEFLPIFNTRFRQKNDFYTLFGLLNTVEYPDVISVGAAVKAYQILLALSPHIRPSQENCEPLKEYAYHCVTQSNSKTARTERQNILRNLLFNERSEPNIRQREVLELFDLPIDAMRKIDGRWLSFDETRLLSFFGSDTR